MTDKELSENEKKVLAYLYEHRDDGEQVSTANIIKGTNLSKAKVRAALEALKAGGYISGGDPSLAENATRILAEMDAGLSPTSRGYGEHLVLVASFISKADETFLADELEFDADFVAMIGSRLRTSGVWSGNQVSPEHAELWTEEQGGISFRLDGAVASGDLVIIGKNDQGSLLYQMTPSGRGYVEHLLVR